MLKTLSAFLVTLFLASSAQAQLVYVAPNDSTWPDPSALTNIVIVKSSTDDREMDCGGTWPLWALDNNCDPFWAHLHADDMDAQKVSLKATPWGPTNEGYWPDTKTGLEVKYYVHGVAVSGWIAAPWEFDLEIDDGDLSTLPNGIHDISVDIRFPAGINAEAPCTTSVASTSGSTTVFTVDTGEGACFNVGDFIYYTSVWAGSAYQFPHELCGVSGDQLTLCTATSEYGIPSTVVDDTLGLLTKAHFTIERVFLHYHVHDNPNGTSTSVPVIYRNCQYCQAPDSRGTGPTLMYVDHDDRNTRTWPLLDQAEPWSTIPSPGVTELFQEPMAPHSDLFACVQMWWQEPDGSPDEGLKFARCLEPKFDEIHVYPNLTVNQFHERLPFKDGGRGVAWVSPYVGGQVRESDGTLMFVEPGGLIRRMSPTGYVKTLAGWVTNDDEDPVWITKDLSLIRLNQTFRGDWSAVTNDGFKTPLDVAIDPLNPTHLYVTDEGNNRILKCVIVDDECVMSVFAGADDGTAGYVNANGTSARFDGLTSLAWDLEGDYLAVADQMNDAIRKVMRNGDVTTLVGQGPSDGRLTLTPTGTGSGYLVNGAAYGMGATTVAVDTGTGTLLVGDRLVFAGVTGYYTVTSALSGGSVSFTPGLAGAVANNAAVTFCLTTIFNDETYQRAQNCSKFEGSDPDILYPMAVRFYSTGQLAILDIGYHAVRRYDIVNNEIDAVIASIVPMGLGSTSAVQWGFIDVDRWGTTGPLDGLWVGCFQCSNIRDGEGNLALAGNAPNEAYAWCDYDGDCDGVFGDADTSPDGVGELAFTDPPHYYWNAIVDPRGAVYLNGSGEHGLTRLRLQQMTDPVLNNATDYRVGEKQGWERAGNAEGGISLAMKYGWGGWGYLAIGGSSQDITTSTTDAEILAMFPELSEYVWGDTDLKRGTLDYLRANMRVSVGSDAAEGDTGDTGTKLPTSRMRFRVGELQQQFPAWERVGREMAKVWTVH